MSIKDDVHPEYRARLVAKELNLCKREDLFAATPPLEAKKLLLSMAVTEGIGYQAGSTGIVRHKKPRITV